jgi:glycosyltransferase involved in cell wall biosynthesis
MSAKLLKIAIPSYNRSDQAKQRLAEISSALRSFADPWKRSEITVVLFENGESPEYAKALAPYLGENIKHVISANNNGLYRNFLRCIEAGDAEWLWILGDDDKLLPGALEVIVNDIEHCASDAIVYNNFSAAGDGSRVEVGTIDGLFSATTVSEALFMSGTIWRTQSIQSYISIFVEYSYSMSPQLSILLKMLEDRHGSALIVNQQLLDHKQSGDLSWSTVEYMRRSLRLVDCLTLRSSQRITAKAHWVNFIWAAEYTYVRCRSQGELDEWRAAFRAALFDYSQYIPTKPFLRECRSASIIYLCRRLFNTLSIQRKAVRCHWKAALLLPRLIRIELRP